MTKLQVLDHLKWAKFPEFEKMNKTSGFNTKKTVLNGSFLCRFSFLESLFT